MKWKLWQRLIWWVNLINMLFIPIMFAILNGPKFFICGIHVILLTFNEILFVQRLVFVKICFHLCYVSCMFALKVTDTMGLSEHSYFSYQSTDIYCFSTVLYSTNFFLDAFRNIIAWLRNSNKWSTEKDGRRALMLFNCVHEGDIYQQMIIVYYYRLHAHNGNT